MFDRYGATLRLRRRYGMLGYGVYTRLVELCAAAPSRKIRYNLDDLVYDTREDESLIRAVVEEFGLFAVDGEYLEDAFARSPEALERRRQEQIRLNRLAGAQKAAETRRAKRAEAKDEQKSASDAPATTRRAKRARTPRAAKALRIPTLARVVSAPRAPLSPEEAQTVVDNIEKNANRFESLKDKWNEIFQGTRRVVTDLVPDAITWSNFLESAPNYSDRDYEEAFEEAKEGTFPWLFRDVIKSSNMQRLLAARETRERRREKETSEDDDATKEVIEHARKMGWNWDEN